MGPHPYPWMVREFQRVVGDEAREQCRALLGGADPDCVVACVGGGSNAAGTFAGFVDTDARLVGVEAGGAGSRRAAGASGRGVPGVVHGEVATYLQDEYGQVLEAHSISAGLDYPGVGPEHAALAAIGPGDATRQLHRRRGARGLPAAGARPRASSRPWSRPTPSAWVARAAGRRVPAGATVLVTLSGRGDKDAEQVAELLGEPLE